MTDDNLDELARRAQQDLEQERARREERAQREAKEEETRWRDEFEPLSDHTCRITSELEFAVQTLVTHKYRGYEDWVVIEMRRFSPRGALSKVVVQTKCPNEFQPKLRYMAEEVMAIAAMLRGKLVQGDFQPE